MFAITSLPIFCIPAHPYNIHYCNWTSTWQYGNMIFRRISYKTCTLPFRSLFRKAVRTHYRSLWSIGVIKEQCRQTEQK